MGRLCLLKWNSVCLSCGELRVQALGSGSRARQHLVLLALALAEGMEPVHSELFGALGLSSKIVCLNDLK